ncbi:hypothetical protein [Bacillus toyonensis]|uniref:hypothetical protein n=1 Tax=Bacillus toyonensis TaxID=155322 RepID=UPI001155CC6D|nr:hypothetical protein [Bacillus toyonensis]
MKNALRVFQENSKFRGIDIEFLEYESEQEMGDAQLIKLLKETAKVPHENKIIGIFDRDAENGKKISKTGLFKYFGNNVYGFSIPTPSFREYHSGICIEFLYKN